MSDAITLLAHPATGRPGCVLLQAVAGCDQGELCRLGFEVEDWISGDAGDPSIGELRMISGTREQWRQVSAALKANRSPPQQCYVAGAP